MNFLNVDHGTVLKLASSGSMPEQVHVFEQSGIDAVNAALAARRPLLVRGEPGIGKSQLARAAAAALGRAYVSCVVDSRTESRDLLWHFDAVTRLAEAQLAHTWREDPDVVRERLAVRYFVIPGPLWWVFNWESARVQAEEAARRQAAQVDQWTPPQPDDGSAKNGCVLLVDEIDKAESDLPNGLLEALGAGQFTPFGSHKPVIADEIPPLVVITTNEERALPDAFVRRCLVLPLSLPGPLSLPDKEAELIALLVERGRAHFPDVDSSVLEKGARQIVADRKRAIEQRWRPIPGQAEYLDLLRAVRGLVPGNSKGQRDKMEEISSYVLCKQAGTN